ncbi:MAG: hypothetical protein AVDCRST_MAG41-780, partial [uncultured Corynebacteriales bacterium]
EAGRGRGPGRAGAGRLRGPRPGRAGHPAHPAAPADGHPHGHRGADLHPGPDPDRL